MLSDIPLVEFIPDFHGNVVGREEHVAGVRQLEIPVVGQLLGAAECRFDSQVDIRELLLKTLQPGYQHFAGKKGQHVKPEHLASMAVPQFLGTALQTGKCAVNVLVKVLTGAGHANRARHPVKQRHANFHFELLDLVANCRRRHK